MHMLKFGGQTKSIMVFSEKAYYLFRNITFLYTLYAAELSVGIMIELKKLLLSPICCVVQVNDIPAWLDPIFWLQPKLLLIYY